MNKKNTAHRAWDRSAKVNVAGMARKILGLKEGTQPKDMTPEIRRDFWCISKMFSKVKITENGPNRYLRRSYKTNGGRGMQLVQNYIFQH